MTIASNSIIALNEHKKNIKKLIDEIKEKPYTDRPKIRLDYEINTYYGKLQSILTNQKIKLETHNLAFDINQQIIKLLKDNNHPYSFLESLDTHQPQHQPLTEEFILPPLVPFIPYDEQEQKQKNNSKLIIGSAICISSIVGLTIGLSGGVGVGVVLIGGYLLKRK